MEEFNLEEWLKDKSRKICTRDGREVTIEKTDIHIHGMSHMILGKYSDIYEIWHSNGRINYTGSDCNLDLFFANEEEELTEFEKRIYSLINFSDPDNFPSIEEVKEEAEILLDLARKDVLKDLPKWKKAKKDEELDCHVAIQQDDRVVLSDFVQEDEYYITLDVLKTLPKEE